MKKIGCRSCVYGEGIFIKFNDQKIDEWLPTANGNINELINRYHQEQADRLENMSRET